MCTRYQPKVSKAKCRKIKYHKQELEGLKCKTVITKEGEKHTQKQKQRTITKKKKKKKKREKPVPTGWQWMLYNQKAYSPAVGWRIIATSSSAIVFLSATKVRHTASF